MANIVKQDTLEKKIFLIRSLNVMLDKDLAELYGIKTKVFLQAVKRNKERFPEDFMFQLSKKEFEDWRSQFVTSSSGDKMGLRYRPYAFALENQCLSVKSASKDD
jgi:hypothetical protein